MARALAGYATLFCNPEHPKYILAYFGLILFMMHKFACKYRMPFPPSSYKESFYSDKYTLWKIKTLFEGKKTLKYVFRKLWPKQ